MIRWVWHGKVSPTFPASSTMTKPTPTSSTRTGFGQLLAWREVEFNKGDVCVVRGDTAHYGIGHAEENVRIHFLIDSPEFKHERGKIFECPNL